MFDDFDAFEKRKQDHIELALMPSNQACEDNPLDTLSLEHDALPDLNFSDVNITTTRLGKKVSTPFIVSSMTAGHKQAYMLNSRLMEATYARSWAMGVGSQRRELIDPKASEEWAILRKNYPKVTLFSNIGIAQLIETPINQIKKLTDTLQAEALIIHCNPLQEVIQPEGTPLFKGAWKAIEKMVEQLTLPIIVKETGCGFSSSTLKRLNNIGVAAVDVSGLGGTHWGRIEGHRATQGSIQSAASQTFKHWGITTLQSVLNAQLLQPKFEIWGSGGVRNGLDAAKLFALGVQSVGFAKPLLAAALISTEAVQQCMLTIEYELKVALFCTGSSVLKELEGKICQAIRV